ncbi:hypothetical protein GGD64_000453 [Bradyrhizobium sp. CIR3A]|nr:hypothetical protein [Bradyrhizobium sp. CIR3A]NYG43515.1 hypothetical protein [Bradyrhizobium sp. IAR9]
MKTSASLYRRSDDSAWDAIVAASAAHEVNPNHPRRSNSRLPGTSDPIGLVSKRQSGPSCHSWPPYPLPPEKCSTPALKESALALNR